MAKISDFILLNDLGLLIAASSDNSLRLFSVDIYQPGHEDEGDLSIEFVSKLQKESRSRVLQLTFERK